MMLQSKYKANGNGNANIHANGKANGNGNQNGSGSANGNGNVAGTQKATTASQKLYAALVAHRSWKARLQSALDTGESTFKPATVKLDNQCEFGKWLYREISAVDQESPHYQKVRELHAKFHLEAGTALELALQGRRKQAEHAIGPGSAYRQISGALSSELIAWHTEMMQTESAGGDRGGSGSKIQTVLDLRAKALAKSTERQTGETMQLVVFCLADETYGIATEFVREVQPLHNVTPVPCTPDFVVGVINIRGSLYSVIDIRSFFGVKGQGLSEATKVILVSAAGLEVGILADDVKGATSVLLDEVKPALAAQSAAKEEYVQGVTKEMLIILNLEALLRDERIIVRDEVA